MTLFNYPIDIYHLLESHPNNIDEYLSNRDTIENVNNFKSNQTKTNINRVNTGEFNRLINCPGNLRKKERIYKGSCLK